MKWWYLSFAGDEGWRGAVIVQAGDFIDAVAEAHIRKINPGGQVKGGDLLHGDDIPKWAINTLLSKADLLRMETEMGEPDPEVIRW